MKLLISRNLPLGKLQRVTHKFVILVVGIAIMIWSKRKETNFFQFLHFSLIRYGMDVIGTVGFGLDVNSIDDPNHSFREIENQVSNGSFINRVRLIGAFFCPK